MTFNADMTRHWSNNDWLRAGFPRSPWEVEDGFRVAAKPDYERIVFDLLEELKKRFPEIAGAFARFTGGVDAPYILSVLREDAVSIETLAEPSTFDVQDIDWVKLARLAGLYGIRYQTNSGMEAFLDALMNEGLTKSKDK